MSWYLRFAPLWAVMLAWIAYGNSLPGAFHLDDFHVVERNVYIRSLDNIPRFFTDGATFTDLPANRDYRPLVLTGFAVIFKLAGLSPWLFSLWSVVLHSLVVVVVFYLARGMVLWTGSEEIEAPTRKLATATALLVAALYAVHTLGTETVNYVNGQAVLLATLFFLSSCLAYARHLVGVEDAEGRLRGGVWLALALLAQVGALLAKPTAITLPLVLAVYDLLFAAPMTSRAALWRARILRLIPFFAVDLAYLVWRGQVLAAPFGGEAARSFTSNVLTQTQALVFFYLKRFLWPRDLSVDPQFPVATVLEPAVLAAFGVLAALALAVILVGGRYRMVAFAACWFAITLLPVTYAKPLHQVVNEHRAYLPMFGLVLPVALGVAGVVSRREGWRYVAVVLSALVVLALMVGTQARNRVWQSELLLWRDAAKQSGEWRPHMNYGLALEEAGRSDQALAELERAVEAGDFARPRLNLGLAYLRRGRVDDGLRELERGVRLWPTLAEGRFYLGYGYEVAGELEKAAREYTAAGHLNPVYVDALRRLAELEKGRGRYAEAAAAYERLLAVLPDDEAALAGLEEARARAR